MTTNLLSVILIAQHLIFSSLQGIMEVLFKMKNDKDQTVFSNQLDECLDGWGTTLPAALLAEIDAIRWELRDPAQ